MAMKVEAVWSRKLSPISSGRTRLSAPPIINAPQVTRRIASPRSGHSLPRLECRKRGGKPTFEGADLQVQKSYI
jgi:hypothetical protein